MVLLHDSTAAQVRQLSQPVLGELLICGNFLDFAILLGLLATHKILLAFLRGIPRSWCPLKLVLKLEQP